MKTNLKHLICLLTCVLFLGSAYAQSKAYVRGAFPPWGQNTNELAMDIAFGAGNWNNFTNFNTPADLWTPTYDVVFLEGGDGSANQLEAYLQANLPTIEAWVNAGGNLLLNSAPNQGNGMSYGFGGVQLAYPSFVPNASSPNPGHPIFLGPAPTQTSFTGNFYGHAVICPAGLVATVLMENQVNAAQDVAVEACFGGGTVIFGGMTTTNWHQPTLLARNLRANMLSYLGTSPCGGGGGGGADCFNNTCITVVCPPDETVQCIEDFTPDAALAGATLTCGVEVGRWVTQPHQTGGPNCDGTTYEYTYKVADDMGNIGCCIQTVTISNAGPTISVPAGTTVDCFADIVVSTGDATVTTSCGEELDVTIYAPVITGDANCPGTTYTYTYRVEDQCEREATASRTFTIGGTGGLTIIAPPNYTCECIAAANPGNAIVNSTCGVDPVVTVSGPVLGGGTPNCPGSTATYTYSATACGTTVSAQQTITISNGPPVFDNCPENCLIINCEDEGYEDVIQAWLASVTATGSCGLATTVTNNYNPNTQGTCISNGTTTVTWTARDACNRTTQCQSMIIINDTEPPIFVEEAKDELDICNYNTPHEFDAWVDSHGGAVVVDCDENITNNQWSTIPNNPSINCNGAMGPTSVTVTFVVRDDCGNKSSSTATFTALMAGGDLVEDGDGPASEVTTQTFELNQNQPNPFSNETVISFSLPSHESATLTIYDMSGKVVKLIQGDFSEGYNEVQISRSELNGAGLLYYELSTANDTAVKKMIIVD